jgi:hypothetical protein
MGLFVNKSLHPTVFENDKEIEESNQKNFKIDPLAEWIEEQKTTTSTIEDSLIALDKSLGRARNNQKNKWESVDQQLHGLTEHYNHHEDFEIKVLESLKGLEEKNEGLRGMLKTEEMLSKKFIAQINMITSMNTDLASQLEKSQLASATLSAKLDDQINRQNNLSDQYTKQEEVQYEVLKRLDIQEGLTEKVLRQLGHLRSIVFERSSYLAEKIERLYVSATSNKAKSNINQSRTTESLKLDEKEYKENNVHS